MVREAPGRTRTANVTGSAWDMHYSNTRRRPVGRRTLARHWPRATAGTLAPRGAGEQSLGRLALATRGEAELDRLGGGQAFALPAEQVQALAKRKPENPELMPPVKPPQQYIEVDAVLPATENFGPAERAAMVKTSTDICEKKGVLGAGYFASAGRPVFT